MAWVMVPVPEELQPQVDLLLFQLKFKAGRPEWDRASIADHRRSLDRKAQDLLDVVAARVLALRPIEDVEIAQQLNVSVDEVFSLVREANEKHTDGHAGELIFFRHDEEPDGPAGPTRRRVLVMLDLLAEMVQGSGG